MNIILDQSLKTDSKQPKVFELGQITTTLQDLLDNSKIVINGEQTIILSITNTDNSIVKYLLPLDYKGESFYGLGQNILESDLISLGSLETRPYKVYTALLTQTGTNAPVATVLENTLGNIVWSYYTLGVYNAELPDAFTEKKTTVIFGAGKSSSQAGDKIEIYDDEGESTNSIKIIQLTFDSNAIDGFDGIPIEIRVYD